MIRISFIVVFLAIIQLGSSQETLVLQPDSLTGKDADISSIEPNLNYGHLEKIGPYARTQGGKQHIVRGLLEFDLSSIPPGSMVIKALLDLTYHPYYPSPYNVHSGDNSFEIKRITSSWVENTVTWNTKPTTTNLDMVLMAKTTNDKQDFPNIDVTKMVNYMVQNPSKNFGFMLRHVDESPNRMVILASSENRDDFRRPKLSITYTTTNSLSVPAANNDEFLVYPNPSHGQLTIRNSGSDSAQLINMIGEVVATFALNEEISVVDVSMFSAGMYFVKSGLSMNRVIIK